MRRCLFLLFCCTSFQWLAAQQPDTVAVKRDTLSASPLDSTITKRKNLKLGRDLRPPVAAKTQADTTAPSRSRNGLYYRFFVKKYPNPRAAALLSFVVPGAGQAYNKRWWKIPIVYGALGGMAWLATDNNQEYKRLRDNYKWVVDEDPVTKPVDAPYIYMNNEQLKRYRDQFRRWTELSYLWLGIIHLLGVTDAFVDAHLSSFDVSEDLSLRIVPDIQSGAGGFGPSFGLGVRLGFGKP